MRERWGTFSVRDHMTDAPFVSDVLLYDRLIIPVPPSGAEQEEFWSNFDTDRQQRCLEILKIKTAEKDGLALTVPWDESKRKRFSSQMSTAAALATQRRNPEQSYYMDPFKMTRQLLKDEFRPALPPDVSHAWTVAAFVSGDTFQDTLAAVDPPDRQMQLAAQVTHRFLTPPGQDPKHELLKRAVNLSSNEQFRRKRAKFYEWQETVIEEGLSDQKAVQELEQLLQKYNEAISKAFKDVVYKYAYTVVPIAMGLTGTIIAGSFPGTLIAGAAGLVQMARFWKFDSKPKIDNGDFDAAAMIHDARKLLFKS